MTSTNPSVNLCQWPRAIAFVGMRCVAAGPLDQVILKAKKVIDQSHGDVPLIFDVLTSETIEVDFRGQAGDVLKRLESRAIIAATESSDQAVGRGPGRPRLGVVGREVTLLPRHWDWLNAQPGGASVALRKLVETARHVHAEEDRIRQAQEATYRFMTAIAGNQPDYEEALRALFAGDAPSFMRHIACWPADVRRHIEDLASEVFGNKPATPATPNP